MLLAPRDEEVTWPSAALIMILLLVLPSCADQELSPINTGIQGSQFANIAVRVAPYESDTPEFNPPMKGASEGASQGAKEGTLGWLGGCAIGTGGILFPICLMLTPVATVTGGIVGAGASHSPEEVTEATTALKDALIDTEPNEALSWAVVSQIGVTKRIQRQARTLSSNEMKLANAGLLDLGFDAVLDVEVVHLDLAIFGRIDPEAAVTMTVRGRLQDIARQSASIPLSWTYQSEHFGYFELANDNAGPLRSVLEEAHKKIASLIIDDLFSATISN